MDELRQLQGSPGRTATNQVNAMPAMPTTPSKNTLVERSTNLGESYDQNQ